MIIKPAESTDRDQAFEYICKIWTYNTYEKEPTLKVYDEVLNDPSSFAFFLMDEEGGYHGFCHGVYFNTFWMTGLTCYVSSIYTNEEDRGKGYGIMLMDHAAELAREKARKALVLDSGLPRKEAHRFYEKYGFEKGCYGFDLML